jgi:hypothetical protein
MRDNVNLHLLRPAPIFFVLALSWVSPQVASATSQRCDFKLRSGALPVIATNFQIRQARLYTKVGSNAAAGMESRLAKKLADSLRCIHQTRFLDWQPMQESESGRAGTLTAYLDVEGSASRYGINLRFEYVIGGARTPTPIADLNSKWPLYGPENRREPGTGGASWEQDIGALFESLKDKQDFGEQLAQAFLDVPLKHSDDLLLSNPKAKMVAIPIREQDLEAKDGTQMIISIITRPPESIRNEVVLTTKRCIIYDALWKDRVQGQLGTPAQEFALLRKRRPGSTTILIKKYQWEYPNSCDQRYATSDAK